MSSSAQRTEKRSQFGAAGICSASPAPARGPAPSVGGGDPLSRRAFSPGGRFQSSLEVIVLSSGRQPRQQQERKPSAAGQVQHPEPPEKVYYKTKLCDRYESSARSMCEDGCTFAHGTAELRPPLPVHGGGWRRPPEHEHGHGHARGSGGFHGGGGGGGRVCFEFRDKGTCHFGHKCAFAHATAPEMRYPGGVEAHRSATPPARVFSPAAAAPRGNSYAAAAPALARAFPPVHAAAVRDRLLQQQQQQEQEDGKAGALTRLSRRKMNGIYGDWPEQF